MEWRGKRSHIQCHFDSDLLFKNYYFSILNKREPSALHNHINDLPLSKCSLLDQQRAIGSRKYCTLLPCRLNPSRLHSSTYCKRNLEKPKALGNRLIRLPLLLEAILLELCSVKIIKTQRKIKVKSRRRRSTMGVNWYFSRRSYSIALKWCFTKVRRKISVVLRGRPFPNAAFSINLCN